jgi:uncharacterized protein (DUF427 family)
VSLTTGRGPLSGNPAGRFSRSLPKPVVYVEPFRRRVRGLIGDRAVIDSERVLLVHRPDQPPAYLFPAGDVRDVDVEPEPTAAGHVHVRWGAVEAWFEEDERVFGHPRNPYHRVDCVRTTRRLHVAIAGVVLVETNATVGVYETALEPRLYVDREHVRMENLVPSATMTYCPYKGTASYWTAIVGGVQVPDVAWSYDDPVPECAAICGLLSFDEARTTVVHDLPAAT